MSKSFAVLAVCAATLLLGGVSAEAALADKTSSDKTKTPSQVSDGQRAGADVTRSVQDKLRTRLVSLGLTVDEADSKIAALTAADLQKLEGNLDQVRMAGVKDSTLILIAVILILPGLIVLMAI